MIRRWVASGLAVLLLGLGVCLGIAGPAAAAVVKPFTLGYDQTIYGDFLEIGNANLRCPTAADGVVSLPGHTPAACAAAGVQGGPVDGNNNFYMVQEGDGSLAGTFNSSTASLTIPPGATVAYARLNWGGDTGKFKLPSGAYSATPSCTAMGQTYPSVVPAGAPATQKPRLAVGNQPATDVTPLGVTVDTDSAVGLNQEQYYSGFADITSSFTGVTTGSPLAVSVGNVWSPAGINCFAGWSLIVVYKYSQLTPVYAPSEREVFIYDGHVRQASTDPPTTAVVSGFRQAGTTAHVGVTAYEGDRQITGDQFKINGTAVNEPSGSGSATNFFVSHADGSTTPNVFNNFSIDAKEFTTTLIPSGSTTASLTFSTSGDGYVAQSLVLSVPVPQLLVTKSVSPTVVHAGDPAVYAITVTNPSGADAANVIIANDALDPACDRNIGSLTGGQTYSYTCSTIAPNDDVSNIVTATGKSGLGDDLTGSAVANLTVIHPAISITKTADPTTVRQGDTVTFTLTVTNTGDTPLTPVTVADTQTPACARTLPGTLVSGASASYTCATTAGDVDFTNTATASGTDQLGRTVSDAATATVDVIHPAITIAKTVSPSNAQAGQLITYSITVTNSGDVSLTNVTVNDPLVPGCDRVIAALVQAQSQTYSCPSIPAPSSTFINTANVTGTPPTGPDVTDSSSAQLEIDHPSLTVTKTVNVPAARPGDPVTFTITITNTGDVPLATVVIDPSFAACAQSIGMLAIGQIVSYPCTVAAPDSTVDNTAVATGTPPSGPPVTATGHVPVVVIHPAIALTKTGPPRPVLGGSTVTFTITATNTGDATLTNAIITDPSTPACDTSVPTLAPGDSHTYNCTTTAPPNDFVNTAGVTATDPLDHPVTADAVAAVSVIDPAITIVKTVDQSSAPVGATLTFTLVVTNTGDVPLHNIAVTDSTTPACSETIGDLLPGQISTFSCSTTMPPRDFMNVATVNAIDPEGNLFNQSSTASVSFTSDPNPPVTGLPTTGVNGGPGLSAALLLLTLGGALLGIRQRGRKKSLNERA